MRSSFFVALGGAALVTIGSAGVVSGRRDGFGMAAVGIGLIVVAVVGTAVALRRIAGQPSAVTTEGGAMTSQRLVGYLRWIAVPIAGLGLVFAFFGLAWLSPVHGGVAVGLVLVSAILWRAFGRSR